MPLVSCRYFPNQPRRARRQCIFVESHLTWQLIHKEELFATREMKARLPAELPREAPTVIKSLDRKGLLCEILTDNQDLKGQMFERRLGV